MDEENTGFNPTPTDEQLVAAWGRLDVEWKLALLVIARMSMDAKVSPNEARLAVKLCALKKTFDL